MNLSHEQMKSAVVAKAKMLLHGGGTHQIGPGLELVYDKPHDLCYIRRTNGELLCSCGWLSMPEDIWMAYHLLGLVGMEPPVNMKLGWHPTRIETIAYGFENTAYFISKDRNGYWSASHADPYGPIRKIEPKTSFSVFNNPLDAIAACEADMNITRLYMPQEGK